MKITSNDRFAKAVLKKLITSYKKDSKPPDGKWHVYDLLFPRQTVAKKLLGYEVTREDIGFFFLGKALHTEVQRVLGVEKSEVQGEHKALGVVGTMDYKGKDAIEIKSSRKWTLPTAPECHYVRQAGYYSVVHNLDVVKILVVYPTSGRTWKGKKSSTVEFRAWDIVFTPKDKKMIEYDMKRTIEEINKALKTKKYDNLPPAPDWIVKKFEGVDNGIENKRDLEVPFWYATTEKNWP